jgi:hypothetical protein
MTASLSAPTSAVPGGEVGLPFHLQARSFAAGGLAGAGSHRAQEVVVNVYQLQIAGIDSDAQLYAARWALFVCHEIRDVRRGASGQIEILYESETPRTGAWLRVLAEAGFTAGTNVAADRPREAA